VENLKEMRIPDHLTWPLRNRYAGQEATKWTGSKLGKEYVKVYPVSLLNLYAEHII